MKHGFDRGGYFWPLPGPVTLHLGSWDYLFQGKFKDIMKYLAGDGADRALRVKAGDGFENHNDPIVRVSITGLGGVSGLELWKGAIVAATPVVNVIAAFTKAAGSKKVSLRLQNGNASIAPKAASFETLLELNAEGSTLADVHGLLNGDRNTSVLSIANIGVAAAKTAVKVMKAVGS